jgi:hypothetical protein
MKKSKSKLKPVALDVITYRPLQVASAEIKRAAGGYQANWIASGLDKQQNLVPLIELNLPLTVSSDSDAERKCHRFASDFLFPLVDDAELRNGLKLTFVAPSLEARREVALAHMQVHALDEVGTFKSWQDETIKTARLYMFAKQMGVASASELVAQFLELPVATIHKRVVRAKERGLIEATRLDQRA